MRSLLLVIFLLLFTAISYSQSAQELVAKVREKSAKVKDYTAQGKMKTSVAYMKAPVAQVEVYFKSPDKLRIKNETGVSFIPQGSVNINVGSLFANTGAFDIIDGGREEAGGLRIIKLLPVDDKSDVVLSTIYIDEEKFLVRKARTTTRENGTFELELIYGKYADWALADKVVFTFNTKDYKLPKGITFDYDDGTQKNRPPSKDGKGKVEIDYTEYKINKGLSDEVFK